MTEREEKIAALKAMTTRELAEYCDKVLAWDGVDRLTPAAARRRLREAA